MLSRALAEMGHEVVIAAPAGSILAERAARTGLETFEEPRFLKSKHLVSAASDAAILHRFLSGRSFDVVDAHGSQDVWAAAAALKWGRHPLPLVFTRHNTKRVGFHTLNRYLYRRLIKHLIVASASVLERYEPFLGCKDLTLDRVSIVHSSYWEEKFDASVQPAPLWQEWGTPVEPILVGVIGRLVPDKGGVYFLRAAAQVASEFPAARFLFVGRGTEESKLREETAALHLADKVRFLGFREDIPQITAALDLSVLPSVDCDASSAVLKEAMALGKPVVATDIGGAREIVEDGVTGFVVPPAQPAAMAMAIREVLRRADRGKGMGEQGRQRVRSLFSIRRLAEGTLAAYRKALENAGKSAKAMPRSSRRTNPEPGALR